jgi:hypothetical protein
VVEQATRPWAVNPDPRVADIGEPSGRRIGKTLGSEGDPCSLAPGGEACAEPGSTPTADLAVSCLSTTEPFADTTMLTG